MADNTKPELRSLFSHADFGARTAETDSETRSGDAAPQTSRVSREPEAPPAAESARGLPKLVERWMRAREEAAAWRARAEERAGLIMHLREQVATWQADMFAALNRAEREYARRMELEERIAELEAQAQPASENDHESQRTFRGADLRDGDFRGADLRGARFDGADLRGSTFRRADMRGSDLRDADISKSKTKRLRTRKTDL